MPITKIYEQMRHFISKVHLCNGDLVIVDELIASNFEKFQLHSSLWHKLQLNITNSTHIGGQYLLTLRSSTNLCRPFESYDQLSLFLERWNAEENMIVVAQNMVESVNRFSSITFFSTLKICILF